MGIAQHFDAESCCAPVDTHMHERAARAPASPCMQSRMRVRSHFACARTPASHADIYDEDGTGSLEEDEFVQVRACALCPRPCLPPPSPTCMHDVQQACTRTCACAHEHEGEFVLACGVCTCCACGGRMRGGADGQREIGAHALRESTRGNAMLAPYRPLPRPLLPPKHHSGQIWHQRPRAGGGRGTQRGPNVCTQVHRSASRDYRPDAWKLLCSAHLALCANGILSR